MTVCTPYIIFVLHPTSYLFIASSRRPVHGCGRARVARMGRGLALRDLRARRLRADVARRIRVGREPLVLSISQPAGVGRAVQHRIDRIGNALYFVAHCKFRKHSADATRHRRVDSRYDVRPFSFCLHHSLHRRSVIRCRRPAAAARLHGRRRELGRRIRGAPHRPEEGVAGAICKDRGDECWDERKRKAGGRRKRWRRRQVRCIVANIIAIAAHCIIIVDNVE